MRIDTKARLAIAAILDIAIHGTNQPVRLADISKRQRVSQSYLEHLFRRLRESGFVSSVRGPGGGYWLNRRLAAISVADVVASVDSHAFGPDPCLGNDCRPEHTGNVTDGLWSGLDDHLRDHLRSMTLESVLANATEAADIRDQAAIVATNPYVERVPLRHEDRPAVAII